ncbi:MAG: SagB/ThcOx family dehydrogenase [Bacteroidales bacterium]|nr:SagB/ThcOx family dehydrogenase [Bacteroidales bacterium]
MNSFTKLKCIILIMFSVLFFNHGCIGKKKSPEKNSGLRKADREQLTYTLPSPKLKGTITVEEALSKRRSHRSYLKTKISAEDLSQILWAAYGISKPLDGYPQTRGGLRTVPSAGALYPLEIYVLIRNVEGIEPGVYKYFSQSHKITCVITKDMKEELSLAALNQKMIHVAPVCLLISAVFSRTTQGYGDRGRERYVYMEAGHSAQNIYLEAEALHLGTCSIGAFNDDEVKKVIQLPDEEEPLYIMPVGNYYNRSEF